MSREIVRSTWPTRWSPAGGRTEPCSSSLTQSSVLHILDEPHMEIVGARTYRGLYFRSEPPRSEFSRIEGPTTWFRIATDWRSHSASSECPLLTAASGSRPPSRTGLSNVSRVIESSLTWFFQLGFPQGWLWLSTLDAYEWQGVDPVPPEPCRVFIASSAMSDDVP